MTSITVRLPYWPITFQRLGLNLDGLDDLGINSMAPAPEPAVFLVPAILLTWLALRTSVAIDALRIVAFCLVIARCHSGDLLKDFLVISAQLVIMVMVASGSITSRGTLQKEDVAELELFNALDILSWDGVVHLVNTLTQAIAVDSRGRRHS